MITKICSRCGKQKGLAEFAFCRSKGRSPNHRRADCKECHRVLKRKHYSEKREQYQRTQQRRNKRVRKWMDEYKRSHPCEECGESHIATLTFHHKDPTQKEFNLSISYVRKVGSEKLLKEIEKCRVLCFNCHAKLHYNERHTKAPMVE